MISSKTKAAYDALEKHLKTGQDYEDAWNLASVQLVNASEVILLSLFFDFVTFHANYVGILCMLER